jgi:dTDP-4-dehydrorhamnose reductase
MHDGDRPPSWPDASWPDVWGGLECTVARVGDVWRDQLRETGHCGREGDLSAIAALGIRTLRYPILWETVSPDSPDRADWSWHDRRMAELRRLGVRPIVGLVHHGAGPRYTSLADPRFAEKLAVHAARVAERYPWVELFTPVNEPLTTARFAGLYGHWHPHGRDYASFLGALVNQCHGVALAMRAIRERIPHARLVQTEDLGRVYSTPEATAQAEHENERRWLSLDLLTGRVGRDHAWREILLGSDVSERVLDELAAEPCPPDIVGINHYLTSDRFLDHELDAYPPSTHGGNGWMRYADVEAVRVDIPDAIGPEARLREAWERYRLPLAVTEVHLGCTREEQLRWLWTVWSAARRLRDDGVDMRAVTVWSMFGAVDWDSLLTRNAGRYEPGVFDVRHDPIRPTALAHAVRSLVRAGSFDHPALDGPGWWRRPDRLLRQAPGPAAMAPAEGRSILFTGFDAPTASALRQACAARGLPVVPVTLNEALHAVATGAHRPWAVLVGQSAWPSHPGAAGRLQDLAAACRRRGVTLTILADRFPVPRTEGAAPPVDVSGHDNPLEAALDLIVDGVSGTVLIREDARENDDQAAPRLASSTLRP